MEQTYLFARNVGIQGTAVLKTTRKLAIEVMLKHRKTEFQLGIICGPGLDSLQKVYGEYAPFKTVRTVEELLSTVALKNE